MTRGATTHNGRVYTWSVHPGDADIEVDVFVPGRRRRVVQSYVSGVLHDVYGTLEDDVATAIAADVTAALRDRLAAP